MTSGGEVDRLVADAERLMHIRNYSPRTRDTYCRWIRRFRGATKNRRVESLCRADVERFLDDLTNQDRLAPKTRNQASSALAFLFREVLGRDELRSMPRAKEPKRIPVVLSHRQARLVLGKLSGKYRLLGGLMYGSGLRLAEAHRLRVKDIDFDLMQISVVDGKGGKDRWVILPDRLVPALVRQIDRVKVMHEDDRRRGAGWAVLPHALARKDPQAGHELAWQFVFPASRQSKDPMTARWGRYHLSPSATQRQVKKAGRASGVPKSISCHTFRRSFATQMLRAGYDVRSVQKLMGHRDVRTTMIYVEAVTDAGIAMRSPLDRTQRRD
jgi:integron integrase